MVKKKALRKLRMKEQSATVSQVTVSGLLLSADKCLEQFPPAIEEAFKHLKKALTLESNNPLVLEKTADFVCKFGDDDSEGFSYLAKAIEIQPEAGARKYFLAAQLVGGEEGVDLMKKCVSLLEAGKGELDEDEAREMLCQACCSIGEVYMTDLCDHPKAETFCEEALQKALAILPGFDPYVSLAELFKVKALVAAGNQDFQGNLSLAKKAKEFALKALECLPQGARDVSQIPEGAEDGALELERPDPSSLPEWSGRKKLARVLIDLDQGKISEKLIEAMMEEDEGDAELWYILGCCYLSLGETEGAIECYESVKAIAEQNPSGDVREEACMWLQRMEEMAREAEERMGQK